MFDTIQYLWVGVELYLINKLTGKTMFGRVQLTRYISTSIALKYNTLGLSNSSLFLQRRNVSFFTLSDRTTIGEPKGCAISI